MAVDNDQGVLGANFLHGYASASYQVEGAFDQGGRGLSVWDDALRGKDNGEVGCDSYHRWREDVELLKLYGANTYRFSISWSRVIPLGGRHDPVNQEGLDYYSTLIDGLLEAGITPMVTLFHWDVPAGIDSRYGGFLPGEREEELYLDFERYARVCFQAFGDRVKHWITHNEVRIVAVSWPMADVQPQVFTMLTAGVLRKGAFDMETDRWHLARTLLLTHARAVKVYRTEFKARQKGQIGITLNLEWMEPFDDSFEAKDAAQRSLDIMAGLYADPIYKGHWNPRMKELVGDRLPDFTPEEQELLAGSSDFFGVNHYSTRWATGKIDNSSDPFVACFGGVEHVTERDGQPIGPRGHNGHPYNVPWGFYSLLKYIDANWAKPASNVTGRQLSIIVTENGYAGQDEKQRSMEEIIDDVERIDYFAGYVDSLVRAKKEGVPIAGYLAWSLMDNLEWSAGYGPCFGVTHVDRENDLKRTPKRSAYFLRDLMRKLTQKTL